MKNVNELKLEIQEKLNQAASIMDKAISESRELSAEEKASYNSLKESVKGMEEQVKNLTEKETIAKQLASYSGSAFVPASTPATSVNEGDSFKSKFIKALKSDQVTKLQVSLNDLSQLANKANLNSDPLRTTDITTVPNTHLGGVSIRKQDGKAFLQNLGVRVITGAKGSFTLKSTASINATFPGEGGTDVSANFTLAELKLSPRRIGVSHRESREFIDNCDDQSLADLAAELEDAIYRRLATDLMYNVKVDANDASTTIAGSTLDYGDVTNLEAGIISAPKNGAFVTSPKVAAYLKKTAKVASVAGPVWDGNPFVGSIDGMPAYGTPFTGATSSNGAGSITSEELIYGDWSESAVAQYGPVDLIINPFSYAKEGEVEFVLNTEADSGIINYRGYKWIKDVSIV